MYSSSFSFHQIQPAVEYLIRKRRKDSMLAFNLKLSKQQNTDLENRLKFAEAMGDWLVKNICGLTQAREVVQAYDIALFPAYLRF
jgi:hypothetical protein